MERITEITPMFVGELLVPSQMVRGVVYVALEEGRAAFLCPCGCDRITQLPLRGGGSKVDWGHGWEFSSDRDTITLSPSILGLEGCRAHFFIRQNRVEWC